MFVVLRDTHELCAKDAVLWEDLKTESFIVARSEIGATIRNYVIKRLAALHQRPDIRQSPVARETLIHLVGLGQGVSLTSEAVTSMPFPDVAFRPIAGNSDAVPFSGVWRLRNSNQALRRFISLARTLSKTRKEPNVSASQTEHERKPDLRN